MDDLTRAEIESALTDFDGLYKNPRTGEYMEPDSEEAELVFKMVRILRSMLAADAGRTRIGDWIREWVAD